MLRFLSFCGLWAIMKIIITWRTQLTEAQWIFLKTPFDHITLFGSWKNYLWIFVSIFRYFKNIVAGFNLFLNFSFAWRHLLSEITILAIFYFYLAFILAIHYLDEGLACWLAGLIRMSWLSLATLSLLYFFQFSMLQQLTYFHFSGLWPFFLDENQTAIGITLIWRIFLFFLS